MKRLIQLGFIVLFGLPTLALAVFLVADMSLSCELNPYAGFSCPKFLAYLMPLATIGYVTAIPFVLIASIWLGFELLIRKAGSLK